MNLDDIKKELETKREELANRVNAISNDLSRKKGAVSADFEEQAQEVENDEVLDGLGDIERKEIVLIDGALERIAQGTFGTCTSCDEKIDEKRINAVPYAVTCIKCANEE